MFLYNCANNFGTPQCTHIEPGGQCSGNVAQVAQCTGSGGSGGAGGTGGTGGTGGGTGGTGGTGGGTGGTGGTGGGTGGTGGTGGGTGGTGGTKSCSELEADYASALASAKTCFGSATACNGMADKQLGCTCQTAVVPTSSAYAQLGPIKQQWYQQNCDAGVVCGPCPTPSGVACLSSKCTEVYN
jgi:hypothetical protein